MIRCSPVGWRHWVAAVDVGWDRRRRAVRGRLAWSRPLAEDAVDLSRLGLLRATMDGHRFGVQFDVRLAFARAWIRT